MSKKTNVMSLSIEPEIQQQLMLYAKQRTKGNKSKAIRDLVERYAIVEEDITPIMIKVPSKLKEEPEELEKWLNVKFHAILKALSEN
jgi:hypothetical protein